VLIPLSDVRLSFGCGTISTANITAEGMLIVSHGADGMVHWVAIGP
jgi:hypothetical protein